MASGPCLDDIAELVECGKGECVARVSLATWATFLASPSQWELYRRGSGLCVHTALYAKFKCCVLGSVSMGVTATDGCI